MWIQYFLYSSLIIQCDLVQMISAFSLFVCPITKNILYIRKKKLSKGIRTCFRKQSNTFKKFHLLLLSSTVVGREDKYNEAIVHLINTWTLSNKTLGITLNELSYLILLITLSYYILFSWTIISYSFHFSIGKPSFWWKNTF